MKAMIMAAGVGSRLMPLTMHIPKPMVPVGNRPLMEHIINLLENHHCKQLIANLHYHAESIRDYFQDGSKYGLSLNYSPEEELMGTAGGVKKCEWFLDDTFVVISGDALTAKFFALVEEYNPAPDEMSIKIDPRYSRTGQYGALVVYELSRSGQSLGRDMAMLIKESDRFYIMNLYPLQEENLEQVLEFDMEALDSDLKTLMES